MNRPPSPFRKTTMTSRHASHAVGLAVLASLLGTGARAQESSYPYMGLSLGQSRANIDEPRITAGLLGAGLATTGIRSNEREAAFKLFGGYQLTPNFAVEAGYFSLGTFGFRATTVPPGTFDGRIRLQGLNLDLVGTWPMTERLSLLGRVGAQYAQAQDRFRGTGAVAISNPNPSRRETNYKLGAGLQYEINPSMLVRGEVERYRINDAVGNHGDVNVVSLSLVIPFGRTPTPVPRAMAPVPVYVAQAPMPAPTPVPAPAPVPVVVAPPPAPVVAAAPAAPPPARRMVRFSADSLFAFDRSEVGGDGKAALDKFARELQGTDFTQVSVLGHTDRLGSAAYNQNLSQQRADAVKSYLVSVGGVGAGKITASGRGESTPVTAAGDCVGNRPTPKLVSCLQPDRRVEVEVNGTR